MLHTRELQFEAHCWGTSYANAEQLQGGIVTAIRSVMGGANYSLVGENWEDEGVDTAGVAVVTTFALKIGLAEQQLPLTPMVSGGTGADNTLPTVAVTAVGVSTVAT